MKKYSDSKLQFWTLARKFLHNYLVYTLDRSPKTVKVYKYLKFAGDEDVELMKFYLAVYPISRSSVKNLKYMLKFGKKVDISSHLY